MNLPRINYLAPGPAAPERSLELAAAPARAVAEIGREVFAVGQQGFRVTAKLRETEEAGIRARFLAKAAEEKAAYDNELMGRSDFDNFPKGIKERTDRWLADANNLGLSPEGKSVLDGQLLDFTTKARIDVETQAAMRKNRDTWLLLGTQYQNFAKVGDRDGMERTEKEMTRAGAAPGQMAQYRAKGEEMARWAEITEDIAEDPHNALVALDSPSYTEGLSEYDKGRARSMAKGKIEEIREGEHERLDLLALRGELKEEDIQTAQIPDKDKAIYSGTLKASTPPSAADRAAAWKMTDNLRAARKDPAVTDEQYREIYNETRGAVLERIPKNFQGDLSKELGYLSPAGRDAVNTTSQGAVTSQDLLAIARSQVTRELERNGFGRIDDEAPADESEKAYRIAEDLNIEAKRFLSQNRDVTPPQMRVFIDSQIKGKRTTTAAANFERFVPGLGDKLRPSSETRFGQSPPMATPDGVLPYRDGSLPPTSEDLDSYLDGN